MSTSASTAGVRARASDVFRVLTAIVAATTIMILVAPVASAENPLYCNGEFTLNNGCNGPRGLVHLNEARNESGHCVAIQWWQGTYGPVHEECFGFSISSELVKREESFPRCWNRTNEKNLIHCRYALWSS